MDKLKINLIPPEIKEQEKKQAKKSKIVKISVGLLGLLIAVTMGILGVIIFQNVTLQALNNEMEQEKTQIGTLKEKEAVIFFLKNRIVTINKYAQGHYKQGETFELIRSLIPPGINMSFVQINKTENISLQGDTVSTASLDLFFKNLMDPAKNEGKIKGVSVESLNRSLNGSISFDLKITLSRKPE